MSVEHTLVINRDTAGLIKLAQYRPTTEQDERDYYRAAITCSDPAHCYAWIECWEDGHVDPEEVDYESITMHGVCHEYINGDWYAEYPGCVAQICEWEIPDAVSAEIDGTYQVKLEWDDEWMIVELIEQENN